MRHMWVDFELDPQKAYTTLGCSPNFVVKFCDWLRSIKREAARIDIALYLFNNEEIYSTLKELAQGNTKVTVYSIPLDGYDNKFPIEIFDHRSQKSIGKKTKHDLASSIYRKIAIDNLPNFELRIVPHMYLRSKRIRPFSRGDMPYSLHCKSFFIEKQNGSAFAGLASSNLAVRDAQKYEMAFVVELSERDTASSLDFYSGLYENSINIREFDSSINYSHYSIKMREKPEKAHFMYLAPFYQDSATLFEKNISTIINNAKERILICAQHISAYNYSFEHSFTYPGAEEKVDRREGFLFTVLQKANEGISTAFLSQTYVDDHGSHGCRAPENKKSFIEFISAAKASNCHYYVNEGIHCKFIVVDDVVIITTCNFTPTQFIYLKNVNIPHFDHMPNNSYSGIHCEFGLYVVIKNRDLANHLVDNFSRMVIHPNTKQML